MQKYKKLYADNEGSALVTVLLILFVAVLLIVGAQMMLSAFAGDTLSVNKSNQAYLNAKSAINTICNYYEDETDATVHKTRITELKTMSGDYTSAFNESGVEVGSSKINISKTNVTYDDGKEYMEVKITATGESDGSEYQLYRVIPICIDDADVTPYYDNAFTQTGGSGNLIFTNGADGPVYNKSNGVDGIKSSKLTDFLGNGSIGTYDGSSVEFKSISVRGYALLKQSEIVYGDVLTGGWSMIGGTGSAHVLGRVYSQSGVLLMNSGYVGTNSAIDQSLFPTIDITSLTDMILSEGRVIITGSQNCLSLPWNSSLGMNELLMESDGVTPVIGTITGVAPSGQVYGNVVAKGSVYVSGTVIGNIYAKGDVKIAGGKVIGNIYTDGDVILTNADNNNAAYVRNSIYAKGNVTVTNSTCDGTINQNMTDVPEVTSKIGTGNLATTANQVLDEAEESNKEPSAIVIPSYLN